MTNRTVRASLLAPVLALALVPAALGSSGDDGGSEDTGIRVVLLQAGGDGTVVTLSTNSTSLGTEYSLGFTANALQSITFGLDVAGASNVIGYEVTDSTLTHHPIGTATYEPYTTGSGTIPLVEGGHQLSFAGPGSVTFTWNESANPGSEPYLFIPNFYLDNGTVSYHPAGEQQWLWFHGSGGTTFGHNIELQAVGGDVEASLVWVGNVSAPFALPDEASDQSGVTLPEGAVYTVTLEDATGILGIRLGDGGSSDGGDGSDGGGSGGGCSGDLNGDNLVNGADLALLLGSWGVGGE